MTCAALSAAEPNWPTPPLPRSTSPTGCLTDGPLGRVGLEIEAHCHRPGRPGPHGPVGTKSPTFSTVCRTLPGGSVVTVEPGGAVELSGPPADGRGGRDRSDDSRPGRAAVGLRRRRAGPGSARCRPAAATEAHQPGRPLPRDGAVLRAPADSGEAGAAMMTSTASVQVNLDAGPRDGLGGAGTAGARAGPDDDRDRGQLAAAGRRVHRVACPPGSGCGARLDSARCGPILGASGDDPASDWARYALKAPVMLVHDPDAVPVTRLGAVRRLGRRPGVARRPPTDDRRPRLPPDHAVPAGAARGSRWRSATSTACPTRSGPPWCSRWSPCSTTRSPRTSPPRPSNRWPPPGTAPPGSASATGGCTQAANRCVARRRRAGARRTRRSRCSGWSRSVEQGRCPGRRLLRPGDRARDRACGRAIWRKGSRDFTREAGRRSDRARDADAAAGRFRRRRAAPAVRPVDEPAGVGPGAHRSAGGALAAARRRSEPARNPAAGRRESLRRL